jgi:hypothetical protein
MRFRTDAADGDRGEAYGEGAAQNAATGLEMVGHVLASESRDRGGCDATVTSP